MAGSADARALWVGLPVVRNTWLAAVSNTKEVADIRVDIGIAVEDFDVADMRLKREQCSPTCWWPFRRWK